MIGNDNFVFKHILDGKFADLLLKNATIVDVNTGTIYDGNIAIFSKFIIAVSEGYEYPAKKVVDLKRKYAVPGFMDAHMHLEPALITPVELSKLLVPHGVLTLFADLMEVANVFGPDGIKMLLDLTKGIPLRVLVEVPSRVPTAKGLENTGGELGLEETEDLLSEEYSASLGELNFQNLFNNPELFLEKIKLAKKYKKVINGHAPHLSKKQLYTYHLSGISDDHESTGAEEVIEKLRIGMKVMVREGSTERNLEDIVKGILDKITDFRNLLFCTDDKFPDDILKEGHIDYNVRRAIQLGLDPITAIQMATINIASHFKLDDVIGSISVGRFADILILDDLKNIEISSVYFEGKLVYKDRTLLYDFPKYSIPKWATNSINVYSDLTPEDFLLKADIEKGKAEVIAIEIIPDQIINEQHVGEVIIDDHILKANSDEDIIHISVVNRYSGSKRIGNAFVHGFNIKNGAIASSFAHDHHNIVVVGDNPIDMLFSVQNIIKTQGGLTVVSKKQTLAHLELPLGGLMSLDRYEKVLEKLSELNIATYRLGCELKAPFMQLQFVTLPSVPKFGISDLGLIDSLSYKIISPIIKIVT